MELRVLYFYSYRNNLTNETFSIFSALAASGVFSGGASCLDTPLVGPQKS